MGTFLLFILIIFFTIIILGFSFLRGIVRLFIRRPSSNPNSGYKQKGYGFNDRNQSNTQEHSSNYHKKIFRKDEGEYIDFEEIKV